MNNDNIYEIIIEWLESLYSEIPYISKDLSDYLEYVKEKLKDEKLNIDSLKVELKDKIIIDILKGYNYLEFLNFYINHNFKETNKIEEIIDYFYELNRLIEDSGRIMLMDDYFYLLKNNKILLKLLEVVYNRYDKFIKNNRFSEVNSNSLLKAIMQAYCDLNNIEIEDRFDKLEDYYSDDSLAQYIFEIRRYPLLNKEEERMLILEINKGNQDAKDFFIKCNLRLVVSVVMREFYSCSIAKLDLIQEGNLGLMRAVEKYNILSENKFSSYAYYWIESFITRAINNQCRTIRVSVDFHYKINKYKKIYELLFNKYGRIPTMQEMIEATGMNEETINLIRSNLIGVVSYDLEVTNDTTDKILDFVEDSDANIEANFLIKQKKEIFRQLFKSNYLSEREKKILIDRFGFNGDIKSLEEIGAEMKITRERVRQLEEKAKRKAFNFIKKHYRKIIEVPNEYQNGLDKNSDLVQKPLYSSLPYPFEQVDYVISLLDKKERDYVELKYGTDLSKAYESKLSKYETKRFYKLVLPKIKLLLEQLNESQPVSEFDTIQSDTCNRLLKLIRLDSINELINLYSYNTIVIGFLKTGYVDLIKYNNLVIANFLNISEEDVINEFEKFQGLSNNDEKLIDILSKRTKYINLISKKETTEKLTK